MTSSTDMPGRDNEGQDRTCLVSIGSNCSAGENMRLSREWLQERFPGIAFSRQMRTPFRGEGGGPDFLNQLALFHSTLDYDSLRAVLKDMERALGRRPSDKAKGKMPMDLDILMMGNTIYKAEDLEDPYTVLMRKDLDGHASS